ncbi:MAG: MotA/TolQ/ExbB proton channel family protein [Pseudomonadota bacterium]
MLALYAASAQAQEAQPKIGSQAPALASPAIDAPSAGPSISATSEADAASPSAPSVAETGQGGLTAPAPTETGPIQAAETNASPAPAVGGIGISDLPSGAQPLDLSAPSLGSVAGQAAPTDIAPVQSPEGADLDTVSDAPDATPELATSTLGVSARAMEFLRNGGPALWAIAALSVVTLALILWKIWRLALAGAWSRGQAAQAADIFETSGIGPALALVNNRRGIRSQVMATTLRSLNTMSVDVAREETARVAKRQLGEARVGLGALELISTVAPLLGLLGTVLGMIAAFQALQAAGSRADPTLLAGGIWEALLTTAAGMAVAIPATAALTWFEAVIERMRQDIEDNATRLFVLSRDETLALAAQ